MTTLTPKMQHAAVVQAMKDDGLSLDEAAKRHPELAAGIELERAAAAERTKPAKGSGPMVATKRPPLIIS